VAWPRTSELLAAPRLPSPVGGVSIECVQLGWPSMIVARTNGRQRRWTLSSIGNRRTHSGEFPAGPWSGQQPIFTTAAGAAGSFNRVAPPAICASSTECGQPSQSSKVAVRTPWPRRRGGCRAGGQPGIEGLSNSACSRQRRVCMMSAPLRLMPQVMPISIPNLPRHTPLAYSVVWSSLRPRSLPNVFCRR